jgi:hypothetical protein
VAYTVAVLMASASAREDIDWLRRFADRRYEFRLLAAADRPRPEPPAEGWYDLRQLLKMEVLVVAGELRLSVQAQGYAALQRVAGRAARLRSPDGAIDLRCGFDGAGRALAVLADSDAVRNTLGQLFLTLDEP